MANALGQITLPDNDTLANLLATYKAPDVVSGGGPLGTIAQAKMGASTAQPLSDLAASHGLELHTQDPVPEPTQALGSLPTIGAPSRASLGSTDADNALVAAQGKEKLDTPKPYDWHAHSILGKLGHVAAGIGNAIGDAYSPELMELLPGTQLNKDARLFQDKQDVQQKTENAQAAGKELDAVNNEDANRQEKQSEFDQEAPERDARVAQANAETAKAVQDTADLKLNNTPLDAKSAPAITSVWQPALDALGIKNSPFHEGMAPKDVEKNIDALKTLWTAKQARDLQAQNHAEHEQDVALQRGIAQQNHADHEEDVRAAAGVKQTAAQAKANQPYQDVIDNVAEAHDFADQKTGYGDYGLVMKFVDATKPKTGFKFNQTESSQIYGARSIADKFRVAYEGGKHGDLLAPEQRKQILQALEVPKNAAMKHIQSNSSGSGNSMAAPQVHGTYNPKTQQVEYH